MGSRPRVLLGSAWFKVNADALYVVGRAHAMCRALKRRGRFVVVRDPVLTSGRKLRTYSGREVAAILFGAALRGERGLNSRDGLELWYGERRPDPGDPQRLRRSA